MGRGTADAVAEHLFGTRKGPPMKEPLSWMWCCGMALAIRRLRGRGDSVQQFTAAGGARGGCGTFDVGIDREGVDDA